MTTADEWSVPADAPAPAVPAQTGPDAPYGRRADGSPRAKPGRKPKGRPAAPRPPSARSSSSAPRKPKTPDFRPGIIGLAQLVAAPLLIAGQMGNRAALADAGAITMHAPAIADGMQTTAEQDERFAAVLERVLAAGPWAALIAPVVGLAVQLGANHGLIPPAMAQMAGALPPDSLIEHLAAQQAHVRAAWEAAAAAAPEPEPVPA